jgi:DNA repair exonuclease SbcCD nuclease subunit
MRIAFMGDLHLRDTIPRGRLDHYDAVLMNKFKFILDFCDRYKIKALIQPGDFFESVSASVYIMRRTAGLLMAHDVKVYMVYGQHDLRYHASDTSNVPLQLFEDFNLVERLHPTGGTLLSPLTEKKKVVGWGSSWNEEIPDTMDPKDINIWATHRMVIDNEKLWDGMKDYTLAKHLLRKNPFALIITGDNHRSFTTKYGIRWLINCGSLGRTNIDQAAHIPHFMIFDTETRKLAKIKVPIRPPKEVLKIEEAKERKRKEAELAELIKGMESATKVQKRVNYKEMVFNVLKKTDDVALSHMMEKIFIAAGSKAMKLELDEEVTI